MNIKTHLRAGDEPPPDSGDSGNTGSQSGGG